MVYLDIFKLIVLNAIALCYCDSATEYCDSSEKCTEPLNSDFYKKGKQTKIRSKQSTIIQLFPRYSFMLGYNLYIQNIEAALQDFKPCVSNCSCDLSGLHDDLKLFKDGITR